MSDLISVGVTVYNSAAFVLETLESIKSQTYPTIELIVSDDCSTDDSMMLVKDWLMKKENANRFVNVILLESPVNAGVAANCNKCILRSSGEWVKLIAGDDILLPDCLLQNHSFVRSNPEVKVLFSRVKLFRNDFSDENYVRDIPEEYPNNLMKNEYTSNDQFQLLVRSDRITYTPSFFFFRSTLVQVGLFNEEDKLVEDYPMWLKLTKAGFRLYFMDCATVGYRAHSKALNNTDVEYLFKPSILKYHDVRVRYAFRYLPWDIVWTERFVAMVNKGFLSLNLNRKTNLLSKLYKLITVYLNPFLYVVHVRKRISGEVDG